MEFGGKGVTPVSTYFCSGAVEAVAGLVAGITGDASASFSGRVMIVGAGSTLTDCGGGFAVMRGGGAAARVMTGSGFGDVTARVVGCGFVSMTAGGVAEAEIISLA